MRLYNTLSRTLEDFVPARDGLVRLYTCGPTVYNYQHIGNYRTYIFEDALKRTLILMGQPVRHVMNITDVGHLTGDGDEGEDKLEVGAKREGKTAGEIARFYEEDFLKDIRRLNILFDPAPNPERKDENKAGDIKCRATEHIPEQMKIVDRLTDRGFTYETSDGVYFDTSKFPTYCELMGSSHLEGLQEGARVRVNPEKKRATDFALWKFSPKEGERRQMEWDYRGRKGFPGWHIECSAMGQTYLGDTFDIHCGGVDHIPVHHSNEIAQAEAATGKKPFVRFWLHAEFLVLNKAKMAKSAGGFVRMKDLDDRGFDPLDYRYFCFGAHYRKQLDFSEEGLKAAKTARCRLKEKVQKWLKEGSESSSPPEEWMARFKECLADDLNMPEALAVVHDAMNGIPLPGDRLRFLRETEKVLALGLFDEDEVVCLPEDLQKTFEDYVAAREAKDFKASDGLRDKLKEGGIRVLDSKEGSRWKRV